MSDLESKDVAAIRQYYSDYTAKMDVGIRFEGTRTHPDLWSDVLCALEKGNSDSCVKFIPRVENSDLSTAGKQWLLALLNSSSSIEEMEKLSIKRTESTINSIDADVLFFANKISHLLIKERIREISEEDKREEMVLNNKLKELSEQEHKKRLAEEALTQHRTNGN